MRFTSGGFSLVELLITMTLTAFLGSFMVHAYIGARQSAHRDEQVARLQENAALALRLLARELAMAGFNGAVLGVGDISVPVLPGECGGPGWALGRTPPLQLADDVEAGAVPVTLDGVSLDCLAPSSLVPGTDVLAIRRSAASAAVRSGVAAPTLTRSSVERWFLRVESGLASQWQRQRPRDLPTLAAGDPEIDYWEAISRIFFVRNYAHTPGDGLPALCIKTLAGTVFTTRCLVEGVEHLQVQFGLDTDGDGVPNRYESAPDSAGFTRAVSANIYLLMRTVEQAGATARDASYHLGDVEVAPVNGSYLRRVFRVTVPLRNRVSG